MKKAGILDGMKSTMRTRLYEQLNLKNNNKASLNLKDQTNRLAYKITVSMIADLMTKCDMPYALSVFLPECGIQQEILSKSELIEILKLHQDEHYTSANKPEATPLLLDIVEILKQSCSIRPNMVSCQIQTEDAQEAHMSLDQKLRKIDVNYMDKSETEKLMPFKSLEERMVKYKRECEVKYREDLEAEIRRLKEFEMSKLRIDEAQKYREKLQQYRDDMENLLQDKLKELKIRESEAWERIKNRERDLDKQSFEMRQKQLRDEEVLRARENEIKKTIEVDQHLLRSEKDQVSKTTRDYELKLKELDAMRIKLQKDHLEEIERFKSDFTRSYKDQDFDIHRRKLQLEEDEQRVKYDKDRIARIETRNQEVEKEIKEITEDLKKFKSDNHTYHKDNLELRDQIKTLESALTKNLDLKATQDHQLTTYADQNIFLKSHVKQLEEQLDEYKRDTGSLIESLKTQLEGMRDQSMTMKDMNDRERKKLKEKYEDQLRRANEKYQFEYEKLESELKLLAKRLGQEEHFSRELAVYNNKLQNNLGTLRSVPTGSLFQTKTGTVNFYHTSGVREDDSGDEGDGSEELLKRKKEWAQIEREQEEIKRKMKSHMRTKPESRVMDDPVLAERVRSSAYNPQKYDYEEKIYEDPKQKALKEDMKKLEKKSSNGKESPKKESVNSQHQKRQWKPEGSTSNEYNKSNSLEKQTESKKPVEEEKKHSAYNTPSAVSRKEPEPVKPQQPSYQPTIQQKPVEQPKPAPVVQSVPVTTANQSSASKKPAFKPATNPFMKRENSSGSTTPVNTNTYQAQPLSPPQQTYTPYGGSSSAWQPSTTPTYNASTPAWGQQPSTTFSPLAPLAQAKSIDNRSNPLRKSTEKSEAADIISDNFEDNYEDDGFEIEQTQDKKDKAPSFLTQNKQESHEDSSGGFQEVYDDDLF